MHMNTIKTDEIIVTIFYDMNGGIKLSELDQWRYEIMLIAVKTAFEIKYLPMLQTLQRISENVENPVQQSDGGAIGMHRFDDFTDIADNLYDQVFRKSQEIGQINKSRTPIPKFTVDSAEPEETLFEREISCKPQCVLQDPYSVSINDQVKTLLTEINLVTEDSVSTVDS